MFQTTNQMSWVTTNWPSRWGEAPFSRIRRNPLILQSHIRPLPPSNPLRTLNQLNHGEKRWEVSAPVRAEPPSSGKCTDGLSTHFNTFHHIDYMQNYFAANLGATERLFHLSQKSSVLGYTQMVHYVDIHLHSSLPESCLTARRYSVHIFPGLQIWILCT